MPMWAEQTLRDMAVPLFVFEVFRDGKNKRVIQRNRDTLTLPSLAQNSPECESELLIKIYWISVVKFVKRSPYFPFNPQVAQKG